ncbi:hypothetical protein U9M48_040799, partial [Paspalum notatum var. saurae]
MRKRRIQPGFPCRRRHSRVLHGSTACHLCQLVANTPACSHASLQRRRAKAPSLHDATTVVPCVLMKELLLPKLQVIAASLPLPRQAEENLGDMIYFSIPRIDGTMETAKKK